MNAEVSVVSRAESKIDENLTKEDANFASPKSILLVPLFRPEGVNENDSKWFRSLYYFYTARLGFPDIPFHFVVGGNGDIYEGNKGGEEQSILINGEEPGSIVIAYLVKEGENGFSIRAYDSIREILLDVANRNAIKPEKIKITGAEVVVNLKNKTVFIRSKALVGGGWSNGMKEALDFVDKNYKPVPKLYSIKIVEAKPPDAPVNYRETGLMTLKIKNTGKNSIYQGGDSEIIGLKKDGEDSRFFVNGVWASPSQPTIMSEGNVIRPGEEKTFIFKLHVPLYFGEQRESFSLVNRNGQNFDGTDFDIVLNVNTPTEKVVEILSTDTGYLNVREIASGAANVITKVNPGQRYFFLEDSNTGWYKIDIEGGKSGWVAKQHVKFVN
ncbi:SH3 domain-containing protein [Candidatus Dojkabacteria bacterium]|nr:SH3 domain-containing protein [Candidatus Dojkabacteria bacterium]